MSPFSLALEALSVLCVLSVLSVRRDPHGITTILTVLLHPDKNRISVLR